MTRYFSVPRAAIWTAPQESEYRDEKPSTPTAYLEEGPRNTGLLSPDGNPILADDRQPAGYLARHNR